jgi:FkbM family methyltransferase
MLLKAIDFDYISSTIKNIIEKNHQENMQEIEKQTKMQHPLYVRLGGRLPNFILNKLHLYYQNSQTQTAYDMVDFQYNKMVCLNFLRYCLENKDSLQFELDLFEKEEDKEEILEYIWNNLYVALSHHNPPLNGNYKEYRIKYDKLVNSIQQNQDAYTLKTGNHQYILPINHFEMVTFYHNYGIDTLPNQVKQQLAGKDFIDAGAFIGDTALILNQYKPNKIYAFEPSKTNYQLMQKTLNLNKTTNTIPVPLALGNKEAVSSMFTWENASFLTDKGNQQVNVTTIDKFQQKNNLNIALIKMDIEGAEYNAIKGAEKTIKQHKPVLIISLYHRGQDFFEIPKLLKQWVPTYKLRFLNLHKVAPVLERVLLAYN